MRIPITSMGLREIVAATFLLSAAAALAAYFLWPAVVLPILLWVWVLWFFRDPQRAIPTDPDVFLAPADGTVTDVTHLENDPHTGGPATRIGIFLSIFDVHINRAPMAGTVASVTAKSGRCHDARDPRAISENASTTILLAPDNPACIGPIVVKQITGLLARRIVCHARPGSRLDAGQRFGMIKFGSRTELIVPAANSLHVAVQPGHKVKAGLTVLAKLKTSQARPQDATRSHPAQARA